jgi:glucose-6-phosphate-specific signal transduction histidine kinase
VTAFTDVEERRRASRRHASATSRRRARRSCAVARRRIIEAADAARAQLERDLHDGAQQQFVSAMLQLQLAERRVASDPDGGRELRAQAIELASSGVDELRRLAAGIHPAILTDRGLGAAVQSLASRLPLARDRGAHAGHAAARRGSRASVYFFVSEALTNVVQARCGELRHRQHRLLDGELTVEGRRRRCRRGAGRPGGSGLRGLGGPRRRPRRDARRGEPARAAARCCGRASRCTLSG